MKTSETIGKIAEALAKAQESMHNATKTSDNPYFNSKYADLAEVLSVCRPELSKNGVAIIQTASTGDGYCVNVTTRLAHSSGEWIEATLTLMGESLGKDGKPKLNQQSIGSAITYARRFTLSAIVGIAQEDDDGNEGAGNYPKNTQPKNTQPKKLTKEESQKIKEEIITKFFEAKTLKDLAAFKNELKPKIML